jgi:hypothetical protein
MRYELLPLIQLRIVKYVVKVFRHLSAKPAVDAVGGGVDLFIVLCQAGIAGFGHRRLLF